MIPEGVPVREKQVFREMSSAAVYLIAFCFRANHRNRIIKHKMVRTSSTMIISASLVKETVHLALYRLLKHSANNPVDSLRARRAYEGASYRVISEGMSDGSDDVAEGKVGPNATFNDTKFGTDAEILEGLSVVRAGKDECGSVRSELIMIIPL